MGFIVHSQLGGCELKWDDARTGAITGQYGEKPVDWGKVVVGGEGHRVCSAVTTHESERRARRGGGGTGLMTQVEHSGSDLLRVGRFFKCQWYSGPVQEGVVVHGGLLQVFDTGSLVFWHVSLFLPDIRSKQRLALKKGLTQLCRPQVLFPWIHDDNNQTAITDLPFLQTRGIFNKLISEPTTLILGRILQY